MFAFVHLAQENSWQPDGDAIVIYTKPAFKQWEQEGITSLSKRIDNITRAQRSEEKDQMGGIRNEGHQIKSEDIIPWINDLEIGSVFKDEDEEKGISITDFINRLVEI